VRLGGIIVIYIIASKDIVDNNRISFQYMFDAKECDIDKCLQVPWGYLRKEFNDDHYGLNLFNSNGLVLGVGSPEASMKEWVDKVPDCSILMSLENAEAFKVALDSKYVEYEMYVHDGVLRTS